MLSLGFDVGWAASSNKIRTAHPSVKFSVADAEGVRQNLDDKMASLKIGHHNFERRSGIKLLVRNRCQLQNARF